MSAFNSWDVYNVLPEHWIEVLRGDAVLGSGGALEVKTWEDYIRENVGEYNDNELPAIGVHVYHGDQEFLPLSKWRQVQYIAVVYCTTRGYADINLALREARQIAVRVERVAVQQSRPNKQIGDVTDDLEGGLVDSIKVRGAATSSDAVELATQTRGAAEVLIGFGVDYTPALT